VEKVVRRIPILCAALLLSAPNLCLAQQSNGSPVAEEIRRALTLEQQSKYVDAESAWKSVVKLQPRNAQAYAHLGVLEARQEHYSEAIANYRKAQTLAQAERKPIPQLNLDLGLALFKSEKFQEAGTVFEAELKEHPKSADAQKLTILTAMSHYGAHQYTKATPYLEQAVAVDPRNLTLLLTLAHCYLWTKQLDPVMNVFKQILMVDPDSAEADMIAGEALDEKGDQEGAVEQFKAAAKANPKEPNVHFALAYLFWTMKRYDQAIPEFKTELENDPKNYQAMIYLGDTYVRQNEFDEAKTVLQKAVESQSSVPLVHLDMGIVDMEIGDNQGAAKELNKAIALEPDNVDAHFRLATVYRSIGNKDAAKVEFAKASMLNKKRDDSVHDRIAAANAPSGDKSTQTQKPDGQEKPDQP
jgi:tetratricopeptide (TPR) repeat protein